MLHISVISHCQSSSSSGVCSSYFSTAAVMVITLTSMSNPSCVDRHWVTAMALMQMMSWSWGWRQDRDHRIQPGYPQWCSVKVKSPYLSSCSSVFVAAREKKIIELISILILPEVALYRSLDSQDQIRFCFPVYLKPSQKVSVISLAQDWIVLWRRSLLIEQHE